MDMEAVNYYKILFDNIDIYNVVVAKEESSKVIISLKVIDKLFDCEIYLVSNKYPVIDKVIIEGKELRVDGLLNFILGVLPKEQGYNEIESKNFNFMISLKIKNFLIQNMEMAIFDLTKIKFEGTKFVEDTIKMNLDISIGKVRKKLYYEENPDQFNILEENKNDINLESFTKMIFELLDKDVVKFLCETYSMIETLEAWYIMGNIIPRKFKESNKYKMLCMYGDEFKKNYDEKIKFRFDY
jgi:hypothetical protein